MVGYKVGIQLTVMRCPGQGTTHLNSHSSSNHQRASNTWHWAQKNEKQALAYGQVKPPPPPDIGTLTYWHTCRESPQTADIPRDMVENPADPMCPTVPVC